LDWQAEAEEAVEAPAPKATAPVEDPSSVSAEAEVKGEWRRTGPWAKLLSQCSQVRICSTSPFLSDSRPGAGGSIQDSVLRSQGLLGGSSLGVLDGSLGASNRFLDGPCRFRRFASLQFQGLLAMFALTFALLHVSSMVLGFYAIFSSMHNSVLDVGTEQCSILCSVNMFLAFCYGKSLDPFGN
jgi:hypothetical protein